MNVFRGAKYSLITAIVALMASGCTPYMRPVLQDEVGRALGTTEVTLIVEQEEIDIAYFSLSAGKSWLLFGPIGAVVVSEVNEERAKQAELRGEPVRDALTPFPFEGQFVTALNQTLASAGGFSVGTPRLLLEAQDQSGFDALVLKTAGDSHLIIRARYAIDSDYRTVAVSLFARLMPVSEALQDLSGRHLDQAPYFKRWNALYENEIRHITYLRVEDDKPEDRLARWLADDAELLKRALLTGAQRAADVLVRDMSDPRRDRDRELISPVPDPTREGGAIYDVTESYRIGSTTIIRGMGGELTGLTSARELPAMAISQ